MRKIIIAALGWLALCGAASAQDNVFVPPAPDQLVPLVDPHRGNPSQSYTTVGGLQAGATPTLSCPTPCTPGDIVVVDSTGTKLIDAINSSTSAGGAAPTGLVVALGLHRLVPSYTGPLIRVVRASDSATLNVPQDALGNLNQAMLVAFQGSSTFTVNLWYDQTINGNNGVACSGTNPALILSVSQFGGLPGLYFGPGGGTACLLILNSSSWQGWLAGASPGAMLRTQYQSALDAANNNRYFEEGSSGANHLIELVLANTSTLRFAPGASTSAGNFVTTPTLGIVNAHVVDVQYSWTNTTNVPTYTIDGAVAALGTSTAPVGTVGTDAGLGMTIANSNGSTTSFPGYINTFMIWKNGPGATQLEAARKAEGLYYGIAVQ